MASRWEHTTQEERALLAKRIALLEMHTGIKAYQLLNAYRKQYREEIPYNLLRDLVERTLEVRPQRPWPYMMSIMRSEAQNLNAIDYMEKEKVKNHYHTQATSIDEVFKMVAMEVSRGKR